MRGPGVAASRRVAGRVRLVDVAPTVLDALDIPVPADMQGRSLEPLLSGGAGGRVERTHYAETLSPRLSQNWGELRALYEGPWKYVHGPKPELFDLAADPKELRNLAAARPDQAATMRAALAAFLQRNSPPGGSRMSPVDDETRARLQALGYLAAGAGQAQEIREELRSDGLAPQDRARDVSLIGMARSLWTRRATTGAPATSSAGCWWAPPTTRVPRDAGHGRPQPGPAGRSARVRREDAGAGPRQQPLGRAPAAAGRAHGAPPRRPRGRPPPDPPQPRAGAQRGELLPGGGARGAGGTRGRGTRAARTRAGARPEVRAGAARPGGAAGPGGPPGRRTARDGARARPSSPTSRRRTTTTARSCSSRATRPAPWRASTARSCWTPAMRRRGSPRSRSGCSWDGATRPSRGSRTCTPLRPPAPRPSRRGA